MVGLEGSLSITEPGVGVGETFRITEPCDPTVVGMEGIVEPQNPIMVGVGETFRIMELWDPTVVGVGET